MSKINNITSTCNHSVVGQEQLFTELTPEEGAVIEGGADYSIGNKSVDRVDYTLNGQIQSLNPNQQVTYTLPQQPVVVYDRMIGLDYNPVILRLAEGKNNFDRNGDNLILTTDSGANSGTT